MKNKKYIFIIIILVILLGLSVAYAILGPNGYKTTEKGKSFFDDVIVLQSNLSYYVGASYSDSFGVYSKEEILLGKNAYELNMEYVNTTLGTKIPEYEGVKFYVVEGDLVKVKLDGTPEWWNNNYNGLIL